MDWKAVACLTFIVALKPSEHLGSYRVIRRNMKEKRLERERERERERIIKKENDRQSLLEGGRG